VAKVGAAILLAVECPKLTRGPKEKEGKGGELADIALFEAISGQPWAWEESTLPPTVLLLGARAWVGVAASSLPKGRRDESYKRRYCEVIHWRSPNPIGNPCFAAKSHFPLEQSF
jgi:hypothetical protein